jgi:hypothetical protein
LVERTNLVYLAEKDMQGKIAEEGRQINMTNMKNWIYRIMAIKNIERHEMKKIEEKINIAGKRKKIETE